MLQNVDIDQGIPKGKMKVAPNEKRKKLLGFSFYTNIGNFEAFLWNLILSANCLFWTCELVNQILNDHKTKIYMYANGQT